MTISDPGRTYGGRYRVLERIGAGGMSEVYRARDELLGREVAVKVLSERLAADRSFVERFRREAQAAANLNHPNIVSLFDYGSDGSSYYIVMEYIDGRSLADIIKADAPLLPERAAEIASDVASALERAHASGIVHRDIKPPNIMITSNGQTKVTDFGIARAIGTGEQTMTQTGMVIGTAAYLSPEQAQGDPVDARSDVYSLGVVLYEMLAGRPPFTGETPLAIAYKHVREQPSAVSSLNPDVPSGLEAIVMKSLAKNPENRYDHAGEVRGDLERYRAGQKVLAPPTLADETMVVGTPAATGTQVLGRTEMYEEEERERRPALVVAGVLLVLLLAGLLAWLLAGTLFAEQVEVPRVVGLTEEEATDRLEEVGLEADVQRRPHDSAPEGEVFRQDPRPGTEVDEGDAVTMVVSTGPEQIEMPDVVGESERRARNILRDAGLRIGEVTRQADDEVEEGNVISQSVAAGVTISAGERIDLVVSSGPETIVPNVLGLSEEDAVAAIEAEGLVASINRAPDDTEEGTVIDQDPSGGTEAEPGDEVTILVSEGEEEREMPDVTGQDADDAEDSLESDFGLNVSQEDETRACAEPPGVVCRQEPEPGTPVSEGDDAILYVQPGEASLDLAAGPQNLTRIPVTMEPFYATEMQPLIFFALLMGPIRAGI